MHIISSLSSLTFLATIEEIGAVQVALIEMPTYSALNELTVVSKTFNASFKPYLSLN
jgi:hypothetical protein